MNSIEWNSTKFDFSNYVLTRSPNIKLRDTLDHQCNQLILSDNSTDINENDKGAVAYYAIYTYQGDYEQPVTNYNLTACHQTNVSIYIIIYYNELFMIEIDV